MNIRIEQLLIASIFIGSCALWYLVHVQYPHQQQHSQYFTVVCTTGMIADAVRAIGGEHVAVHCLMGPGIDPHVYRACEGDVHLLAQANLILYNGLHLEGKMGHVLAHLNNHIPAIAVTDTIPRSLLIAPSDFPNTYDPHVWLDVNLWCYAVEHISALMQQHDPAHAPTYAANTQLYLNLLHTLHTYVHAKADELLLHKRILVTAHDAFSYFGRAYNFQVIGLQGISTESETGTKDISNLADFLVTHKVPAIFVESSVPQRAIEAVQCATHARGWHVTIGPELFSDALGNPETPPATYEGMVRYNIDAIVSALQETCI